MKNIIQTLNGTYLLVPTSSDPLELFVFRFYSRLTIHSSIPKICCSSCLTFHSVMRSVCCIHPCEHSSKLFYLIFITPPIVLFRSFMKRLNFLLSSLSLFVSCEHKYAIVGSILCLTCFVINRIFSTTK